MKTAILYANRYLNQRHVNLPNAATRRQILQRYLDHMLLGACGVGLAVAIIFLAAVY